MAGTKKLIGTCFGRFDLIHYGHINLFRWCKAQCDILLVGVASDEYCAKFNPVKNQWRDRAEVVRAIKYVDSVYCHDSENPRTLWYETCAADIMFLQAEQRTDSEYQIAVHRRQARRSPSSTSRPRYRLAALANGIR